MSQTNSHTNPAASELRICVATINASGPVPVTGAGLASDAVIALGRWQARQQRARPSRHAKQKRSNEQPCMPRLAVTFT
jgi:hypothetical protein